MTIDALKKILWERQLWDTRNGAESKADCAFYRAGIFSLCLRQNVTGLIWLVQLIGLYWSSDPGVSAAAPLQGSALFKDDLAAAAFTATWGSHMIHYIPGSWGFLWGFTSDFLFVIGKGLGHRPRLTQKMRRDKYRTYYFFWNLSDSLNQVW